MKLEDRIYQDKAVDYAMGVDEMELTQDQLKARLRYRPETGFFYWISPGKYHSQRKNRRAGVPNKDGYIVIRINTRLYRAHRLAWLYVYGELPRRLDHKNRNRSDNRIENLRPCTQSQNMANQAARKTKTGFRGVEKRGNRFKAYAHANGKKLFLGSYSTPEEASAAHETSRIAMWGDFA